MNRHGAASSSTAAASRGQPAVGERRRLTSRYGSLARLALALAVLLTCASPIPAFSQEGGGDPPPDEIPAGCDLACANDEGVCQKGEASFPDYLRLSHSGGGGGADNDADDATLFVPFLRDTSDDAGQYCWCPDGYTGYDCSHRYDWCYHNPPREESVDGDGTTTPGTPWDGFACFHGGECREMQVDGSGKVGYFCDCQTAAREEDGTDKGLFAGLHCEYSSTQVCTSEGAEESPVGFCVNGGSCKAGETRQQDMCDCTDGWTGPHCELRAYAPPPIVVTIEEISDCDLDCSAHDGTCQKGFAKFPDNLRLAAPGAIVPFLQRTNDGAGQYCVCPEGWTGYDCEHQYKYCWEEHNADDTWAGGFACFHGSICKIIPGAGPKDYICDCSAAAFPDGTDRGLFAGTHCEHHATGAESVCWEQGGGEVGGRRIGFCVNGGTCRADGGADPSDVEGSSSVCICPPEWNGPHCEYFKGMSDSSTLPTTTTVAPKTEPAPEEPDDCGLQCDHDGVCQDGSADFPNNLKLTANNAVVPFLERVANEGGEYCWCPDGWTGYDCAHEYKYCWEKSAVGDGTLDHGFACFHGGTCKRIPTGGTTDYICDCTAASLPDGTDLGMFAGAHCEHSAREGNFCRNNGDPNETWVGFCVNGGTCISGELQQSNMCDCPESWTGPHCEFYKGNAIQGSTTTPVPEIVATTTAAPNNDTNSQRPTADPNCDLKCSKKGVCQKGDADYGIISPKNYEYSSPVPFLEQTSDETGQYCWCPPGLTGFQCGHKYKVCDPDNTEVKSRGFSCFHSSKCTNLGVGGLETWACDCSTANNKGEDEGLFAGRFCEHEATQTCRVLGTNEGLSEKEWFCVNQGTCKNGESNPYKICQCPDGWTGPHCEYAQKSVAATEYKSKKCSLDCRNGGACVFGVKDYGDQTNLNEAKELPWLSQTHSDGMHCVCPTGYTGLLCQIPAEKCSARLWCYNGSQCKKTEMNNGATKKYCDCSDAATKQESFAGIGCQHKSGVFCDPDTGTMTKKMSFCVNGGSCYEIGDGDPSCDCPDGWSGQHCEFHKSEAAEYSNPTKCKLECKNGGKCLPGVKDYGIAEKYDLPFLNQKHDNFEYCICPAGFTGLDCSIGWVVCDKKHVCAHGSTCESKGQSGSFTCNCAGAKNEKGNNVAGEHCQHEATEYCEIGQSSSQSFCSNGGKCIQRVAALNLEHPGCLCPSGWTGDRCEIRQKESNGASISQSSAANEQNETKRAAILFSIMLAIIVVIICIAVVLTKRCASAEALQREDLKLQQEMAAHDNDDTFVAESVQHAGSCDSEMSEVDIL